jgi:hypothetical protein
MTQPTSFQPRLNYLDFSLIKRVLAGREHHRNEFLQSEKSGQHKIPQRAYVSAFYDSQYFACAGYALGAPLSEARHYLAEAARWMEKVFELRGTSPTFPVTVVTLDPASPLGKPQELSRKRLHPSGEQGYSLTNSSSGLQGMYLALIVGDLARAQHIAEMVWDPPEAEYIGPDSEVCTPDQQHLAYATKQLILKDRQAALAEVGAINSKTASADIRHQATMVRAIAVEQNNVLLGSLSDLLAWHQKMALRKTNLNNPEFFLSVAGLGLCALALHGGIVQREQLPGDNVYLPIDLIPRTWDKPKNID